MWERWRQGRTLHQIAQLFNRAHTSVQGILSRTGGIRPPERTRSQVALTLAERAEISRAMAAGFSIRSIALILGRAPSTISREIKRNGGPGCYRATRADQAAWDRARRPKRCRPAENQSRPITLGRSNWLFAGSLRAGQRAAAVMSLKPSRPVASKNSCRTGGCLLNGSTPDLCPQLIVNTSSSCMACGTWMRSRQRSTPA